MWWIFWLALIVVSVIVECLTTDLVSIWFAGGAFVSLIISLIGFNNLWYIQIPVFIAVSLACLAFFRKQIMKKFNINIDKTNAEAVIGKEYKLLTGISFNNVGTIKVNGVVWNAIAQDENAEIKEGTIVKVIEIKGNKYIVKEI